MPRPEETKTETKTETSERTVADELTDMINAIGGSSGESAPEPEKEPEKADSTKEESSDGSDSEEGEEDESDQKTETQDSSDEDKTPVPDDKDKIIEDLRRQLAESGKSKEGESKAEDSKQDTTQTDTKEPELQDFLGDLDLDDLISDKDSFNKLLNNVYQQGIKGAGVVREAILRDIPSIVRSNVTIISEMQKATNDFYSDNPDLAPFKKVVAAVFEETQTKNPSKKFTELLDEVGKEARRRLDLHKRTDTKTNKGPRLPTKKGGPKDSTEKPDTSPLQSEISEMNKGLGRN